VTDDLALFDQQLLLRGDPRRTEELMASGAIKISAKMGGR
jgi:hypothetical protein